MRPEHFRSGLPGHGRRRASGTAGRASMRPEHFRSGLHGRLVEILYTPLASMRPEHFRSGLPAFQQVKEATKLIGASMRPEHFRSGLQLARQRQRPSRGLASMRPEHFRSGLPHGDRGRARGRCRCFNEAGAFPLRITRPRPADRHLLRRRASMRPEHFRSGLPVFHSPSSICFM